MPKFLLEMTLQKQGKVVGSAGTKAKNNKGALDFGHGTECHSFDYAVKSQFDADSGQLSGKRQHKPIVLVRDIDEASPRYLQALATNEVFTSATLSFNRVGQDGKPTAVRTIELTNGTIAKIRPAPHVGGKSCHEITLNYEDLKVDGVLGRLIPLSMLG
jgi:type VI secretion system Hcp family effector